MSYRKLDIWILAKKQCTEIHKMSLTLPKFELYEEGQQIRRSSNAVGATIVEGYGRRRYNADYIRFLVYSIASNDETIYHLETLEETGSLTDLVLFKHLHAQATLLGKMLNNFIDRIEERG